MKPFVNHSYETDDEIVKRHMHRELETWISQLDAMISEADQLAKIISTKLGDKELREELLDDVNENIHFLNELYTYRNLLNNVKECDELECDQFYMLKHDHVFEKYVECVAQYRTIIHKVYQRLLL